MELDVGRYGFRVSFIVVWHAIGILCTRLLRHLLKAALVVAQRGCRAPRFCRRRKICLTHIN